MSAHTAADFATSEGDREYETKLSISNDRSKMQFVNENDNVNIRFWYKSSQDEDLVEIMNIACEKHVMKLVKILIKSSIPKLCGWESN